MSVLLYLFGALAAISAFGVVFSPQPLYSALSLVLTIGALAALFLVLNAQFLFVVQLIVYAGAVAVLFVFIIALLNPNAEQRFKVDTRFVIGVVVALGITIAVIAATRNGVTIGSNGTLRGQQIGATSNPYHAFSFDQSPGGAVNAAGNVQTVGGQLFTTFLMPFELTSLLLLVAAVGAVYMTRRRGVHTAILHRTSTRDDGAVVEEEHIEVEVG